MGARKKTFDAMMREIKKAGPGRDIFHEDGAGNCSLWTFVHQYDSRQALSLLTLLGYAQVNRPLKVKLVYLLSKEEEKQWRSVEKEIRGSWNDPPENGMISDYPPLYRALSRNRFDAVFLLLIEGADLNEQCRFISYSEGKVLETESEPKLDQTLSSYIQENSKKHDNAEREICTFAGTIIKEVLPELAKLKKGTLPNVSTAIKTNRVQSKQKGKQKQIIQNTNKQESVKDRVKALKALASFYRTDLKAYADTSDVIKIHLLTRAMKLYQQAVVLLQAEIKRLKTIKTKHAQLVRKMKAPKMNESTTAMLQQSQSLIENSNVNDDLGIKTYSALLIQCQTQRDACFMALEDISEHDSNDEYLGYWTLATEEIPRPQLAQKQTSHPVAAVAAYFVNGFYHLFASSSKTGLTYEPPENQY
jgi:hypothetical protein